MKHALWLGLSFTMWASGAQAQQLALEEPDVTQQVALTPPCLGCKASLRAATQHYAPDPSPPVPAAQPEPRPVKKPQLALGDSWKLGGGRTLSVRLTPTPEECAPLVKLSF
ncbi:MAG: hypothetical protein ABW352_12210 [Polyangiales bacterium]